MAIDFVEKHKATARCTNDDSRSPKGPHASTYVCDREECRDRAVRWVQGMTGQKAFFIPFDQ